MLSGNSSATWGTSTIKAGQTIVAGRKGKKVGRINPATAGVSVFQGTSFLRTRQQKRRASPAFPRIPVSNPAPISPEGRRDR
jgi:hypothetical protein